VEKRMNFSAGQAIPYRFVFKTVFRQWKHRCVCLPTLFAWSCSLRLFPISTDQIFSQRNPFCVGRKTIVNKEGALV
jgi:hypothetical protein